MITCIVKMNSFSHQKIHKTRSISNLVLHFSPFPTSNALFSPFHCFCWCCLCPAPSLLNYTLFIFIFMCQIFLCDLVTYYPAIHTGIKAKWIINNKIVSNYIIWSRRNGWLSQQKLKNRERKHREHGARKQKRVCVGSPAN